MSHATHDRLPVSGVIPVQEPDLGPFRRTLESLADQSPPPTEVVVVDASPGAPATGDLTLAAPYDLRVIHRPDLYNAGRTIPLQRRIGIRQARSDYIWRLDEDAVFDRSDHLATLLDDLQRPGVVAACSRVAPLDNSPSGRFAAHVMQIHPAYGLFPVYHRSVCPDGTACYPHDTTRPLSPRASDVTFVRELMRHGRIYRNDDLEARTALPMTRQKKLLRGGAAAAAAAGAYYGGLL